MEQMVEAEAAADVTRTMLTAELAATMVATANEVPVTEEPASKIQRANLANQPVNYTQEAGAVVLMLLTKPLLI